MQTTGYTNGLHVKLSGWSVREEDGNLCVGVKYVEIRRKTRGEGDGLENN